MLQNLFKIIKIFKNIFSNIEKILDFEYPSDLKKKLDLEIGANPLPLNTILNDCKTAMDFSVKTGFFYS